MSKRRFQVALMSELSMQKIPGGVWGPVGRLNRAIIFDSVPHRPGQFFCVAAVFGSTVTGAVVPLDVSLRVRHGSNTAESAEIWSERDDPRELVDAVRAQASSLWALALPAKLLVHFVLEQDYPSQGQLEVALEAALVEREFGDAVELVARLRDRLQRHIDRTSMRVASHEARVLALGKTLEELQTGRGEQARTEIVELIDRSRVELGGAKI